MTEKDENKGRDSHLGRKQPLLKQMSILQIARDNNIEFQRITTPWSNVLHTSANPPTTTQT